MSFFPGKDPALGDARASDAIEQIIVPRTVDLGDFEVHRALPSARTRMGSPKMFTSGHFSTNLRPSVFSAWKPVIRMVLRGSSMLLRK